MELLFSHQNDAQLLLTGNAKASRNTERVVRAETGTYIEARTIWKNQTEPRSEAHNACDLRLDAAISWPRMVDFLLSVQKG